MIAPEGKIIIIPSILAFLIFFWINLSFPSLIFKWINIVLVFFIFFSLYFFRDPQRLTTNNNGFLSPADGKIIKIIDVKDDDIGIAKQISIFLSIFDVHSQRIPYSSRVINKNYNVGKFHLAFNDKASLDNEQTLVFFETENGGKYKIKQIAGYIARRIINYLEPGNYVNRGDRFGFIRFGSRVDIIVPVDFTLVVKEGDKVKAGTTIIGDFQ